MKGRRAGKGLGWKVLASFRAWKINRKSWELFAKFWVKHKQQQQQPQHMLPGFIPFLAQDFLLVDYIFF